MRLPSTPCCRRFWHYMSGCCSKRQQPRRKLFELRQRILDPAPGLFNIGHAVRKREADAGRLAKSISHYRRNVGIVEQVHAEGPGIADRSRPIGFTIIIGYVRKDVESALWFEAGKAGNIFYEFKRPSAAGREFLHHFKRGGQVCRQGYYSGFLCNAVGSAGKLAL